MKRIIVTDLTHFANQEIVCLAGICSETGECIRPMPYLKKAQCESLKILPGSILSGDFTIPGNLVCPHFEDRNYKNLKYCGPCTSDEFHETLDAYASRSINDGFSIKLKFNQKYIPVGHNLSHSIVTIKIDPLKAEFIEDDYHEGKIRFSFIDNDGADYRFWSITDLGFCAYALRNIADFHAINKFIKAQDELFLRIGLSRQYKAPDGREGYWLQINGVYSFPEYCKEVRSY